MADPSLATAGVAGGFPNGYAGPAGYAGFGGPGAFGLDGGLGGGLGGGFGGPGIGGFGGPWAPYVPVTPLGALAGVKGDLILPVVAVGVALFILLIIFLAVKAALAWKIDLLDSAVGAKRLRREVVATPPAHDEEHMSQLASIVINALDSESCLDKIICSIGNYGKGAAWPSYFAMMESMIPQQYRSSLTLLKSCADGSIQMEKFRCGKSDDEHQQQQQQPGQASQDPSKNANNANQQPNPKQDNNNKKQQVPSKSANASAPANEINNQL